MIDKLPQQSVTARLKELYHRERCEYEEQFHEQARTSQESAIARGEEPRLGGKALLLKAGCEFMLFVLPADRKMNSSVIRKRLSLKKIRFATKDELLSVTGLAPGAVPPFGDPIFPLPLHVDSRLLENARIAFNAGSLTCSHILSMDDYVRIAKPTVLAFSS